MFENNHRRCAKCGRTRAEDTTVTYHRFPKPANANVIMALAWAEFCWANQNWTTESSNALHTTSKVLCARHFNISQFYDNNQQKLSCQKFAFPDITEVNILLNERENMFMQNVEQTCDAGRLVSRVVLSHAH